MLIRTEFKYSCPVTPIEMDGNIAHVSLHDNYKTLAEVKTDFVFKVGYKVMIRINNILFVTKIIKIIENILPDGYMSYEIDFDPNKINMEELNNMSKDNIIFVYTCDVYKDEKIYHTSGLSAKSPQDILLTYK